LTKVHGIELYSKIIKTTEIIMAQILSKTKILEDVNASEWKNISKGLRDIYPYLSKDDLKLVKGKEGRLIERLQDKTGQSKQEVLNNIAYSRDVLSN
jgi:hypothetical protein